MKSKNKILIVRFATVLVLLCAIAFFAVRLPKKVGLPAPLPDAIATGTALNGNIFINDKTAGYAITVPKSWYLEKSAGSGIAVYPDYDVADKAPPDCKIEISSLPNTGKKELAEWVPARLHEDPTADVLETSRSLMTVSGAPAMLWRGDLSGVSSTLAYVSAGEVIYEVAPVGVDCERFLAVVLKSFQLAQ